MMTVKQLAERTGVTVRTLQFYDRIGLFKPTAVTDAGYRLYDESACKTLQQILFFKELDFTLQEIQAIMETPTFEPAAAFAKQRELITMKRDRLNALLEVLDHLIKGETCMDFQHFDMSAYFNMLDAFKKTYADEIAARWGGMEPYDAMVSDLKAREREIAESAVRQYGSVKNYAKASETNLREFIAHGYPISGAEASALVEKTEALTKRLTADLGRDVASDDVQKMVGALIALCNTCNEGIDMGENYWPALAESYRSDPMIRQVNDRKYGEGATDFLGRAIEAYLSKQARQEQEADSDPTA